MSSYWFFRSHWNGEDQFFWPNLGFGFEPFPQILECYNVRLQSVSSAVPKKPLTIQIPSCLLCFQDVPLPPHPLCGALTSNLCCSVLSSRWVEKAQQQEF